MFRTKIVLLVVGVLLLSALLMMFFTVKEVKKAMESAAREEARNQLRLIKLTLENEYQSIVFQKEYALQRYQEQLKNVVGLVVSQLDQYYDLSQKGVLSEAQAQELAAESVRKFKYGHNDYFFIYDFKGVNVSHPDPALYKRDLSQFRDVKGTYAVRDLIETAKNKGSGFNSFWYIRLGEKDPVEKLSYVELYRKWDWIIGTGVYIDDIKKDTRQRLDSVMRELKETFARVTLGKSGYLFLFNRKKEMLIHPTLAGKNLAGFKHPVTGTYYLDDLIEASKTPEVPCCYLWDKPPHHENQFRFLKESFVDYFEPLGWYIACSIYRDEIEAPARRIIHKQMAGNAVILIMSALLALVMVQQITRPLKILTFYARKLSSSDFSRLDRIGARIGNVARKSRDEIGQLADAFAYMINSLINHIKRLKETTAVQEKIESDLRIAHDIQMNMVPHPPALNEKRFELHAVLEPALQVGGDFYDFFFVDSDRICLVIGDVSDKGVPAALFMSKSITTIRLLTTAPGRSDQAVSPADVLNRANRELCRENTLCMFVTIFLAVFDPRSGELIFASAAQPSLSGGPAKGNRAAGGGPRPATRLDEQLLLSG